MPIPVESIDALRAVNRKLGSTGFIRRFEYRLTVVGRGTVGGLQQDLDLRSGQSQGRALRRLRWLDHR